MARVGFRGDPEAGSYEDPEGGGPTAAYEQALKELEGLSLHELLLRGQENLLRSLVAKSMAGEASHQEAAILRNLLRDNGMVMGAQPPTKTIEHRPLPALPHFEDPQYDE